MASPFPGMDPFIEISGRRLSVVGPLPPGDFYAFVRRGNHRPNCQVYSWSIRRLLPSIPIPLKPPDADATLDLARAVETTFNGGRFERALRYDLPVPAGLHGDDRMWAAEQIKTSM